jgi:hypothetical protein
MAKMAMPMGLAKRRRPLQDLLELITCVFNTCQSTSESGHCQFRVSDCQFDHSAGSFVHIAAFVE